MLLMTEHNPDELQQILKQAEQKNDEGLIQDIADACQARHPLSGVSVFHVMKDQTSLIFLLWLKNQQGNQYEKP